MKKLANFGIACFAFAVTNAYAAHYDVPQLIQIQKSTKEPIQLIFDEKSDGCFAGSDLKMLLLAGAEVTLESCNYALSELLELSKYGHLTVVANTSNGAWDVNSLTQMAAAGIKVIIH